MKMNPSDILGTWGPPPHWMRIRTIEMHTGGEPLRVILAGLPEIPGHTILEKRRHFREHYDAIRTGLMFEPRGHADMYGAVITEPTTPDGDMGVFFLHNEGYSTMCGHAIIALTRLAIESGLVKPDGNSLILKIDAPSGRIVSSAELDGDKVIRVSFLNVPSYVLYSDLEVEVPGLGMIRLDVVFGGAYYAVVDAVSLGLRLDEGDYTRLIDYGRKIKQAVADNYEITHPHEKELGFLYGTIFTGPPYIPGHHSRNVCVFADGEVDRSPTGTGISARAAIHFARGEIRTGERLTIESIIGTTMDVSVVKTTRFGPFEAVIPQVSGKAHFTGIHEFLFDPSDPLVKGFIFR